MNTFLAFVTGSVLGGIFGMVIMFWIMLAVYEDTPKRRR